MMSKRTWLILAGALTLAGCDNPTPRVSTPVSRDDVRRESREAAEATGQYARQKKDEYHRKLQEQLADLDKQTERWQEKADKAAGKAKEEMREKLKELRAKREVVAGKLKELSEHSGEAWEDLKVGLDRAYDDLRGAFDKAKKHFE